MSYPTNLLATNGFAMGKRSGQTRLSQDLVDYLDCFQGCFRRLDQARWMRVYVQALLETGRRKNVRNLARKLKAVNQVGDPAQALQYFLNQSPWDEGRVWQRFRQWLLTRLEGPPECWLVEDLGFGKQGRHSVGVQRQFWGELGRKANCQLAVSIFGIWGKEAYLLHSRLYLPRSWSQDPDRLGRAGVPQEFQTPLSKSQLALTLLDELNREGPCPKTIQSGARYGETPDFRDGIAQRLFQFREEEATRNLVSTACRRLRENLGLDHFEGRSWRGFHHHLCLVALMHGFLQAEGAW